MFNSCDTRKKTEIYKQVTMKRNKKRGNGERLINETEKVGIKM